MESNLTIEAELVIEQGAKILLTACVSLEFIYTFLAPLT